MAVDPQRVRTVFLAAAKHQELADRAVVLDTECAGDLELRRRVEVLLNDYDRSDGTIHSPAAGSRPDAPPAVDTGISGLGLTVIFSGEGVTSKPTNRAVPAIKGYEVLGELGRGGMGVVYRARQIQLNRPCVLKMILAGVHADDVATRRFLAEAEAVARLQHPNIVQIRNIGEAEGLPYFELEYLEGGSLDRRLDGTPWPAGQAAALVEALARGVAEAHRVGIIHRDLKPANVLLAADGTPKVTDFGLAKALGSDAGLTRTDSILGSPRYMAPEQATGKSMLMGTPADVYSLGAILYELLTGRAPFVGTTVMEILYQVETIEPVPPTRLVPGLSRDVETIALKCLQKEPARRYESATALAEDLRRFLVGEPIVARPVPFWNRSWRWCRRHPASATLTAALVLVATLGLAGILWQWDEAVKARNLTSRAATAEAAARREADVRRIDAESSLATARKAVDDSFTKVSESNLLNVPGMRPLRRELLESALTFYEEFARRGAEDPGLLAELAATQARIGLIYTDLSEIDKARVAFEHAAKLYEKILTTKPDDLAVLERLAEVEHRLGDLGWRKGVAAAPEAQAAYQRAIAIRERLAAERPGEPRFRMDLSRSWNGLGVLSHGEAQIDAYIRSLELQLKLADEIADDSDLLHGLGLSLQILYFPLVGSSHREEALELARRSIDYARAGLARRPYDSEFASDLSFSYRRTYEGCRELGRREEALAILAERISYLRTLALNNPDVLTYRLRYAEALAGDVEWLVELGESGPAVSCLREAAKVLEANPGQDGAALVGGASYRTRAWLLLAGDRSGGPEETWPEEARREIDLAVADLKRAVDEGFRGSTKIREINQLGPLLDRSDVKSLFVEMDQRPAKTSSTASETPTVRPPSPLDQPGRLEEDRILGGLAIILLKGDQGQPGQYTSRLRVILDRIDAHRRSGHTSPALERTAETICLLIGNELMKDGKPADAQALLSRLPDETSDQPQALVRRAELFESIGLTDPADAYWTRALASAPDDLAVHRTVAAVQARRGRWDLAAETLAGLVARNPEDHRNWYLAVVVAARAGNAERWQRLCRPMLDRFQETDNAEIAERTAKSCLLMRTFGGEQQEAGQLAEHAVEMATGSVTPWALNARALASYRSGNFAGALASADASLAAFGPGALRDFQVPAHCVRAMALVGLGQLGEARAALGAVSALGLPADSTTTEHDPGQGWIDPLISEILYREAEALINHDPVLPTDPE